MMYCVFQVVELGAKRLEIRSQRSMINIPQMLSMDKLWVGISV